MKCFFVLLILAIAASRCINGYPMSDAMAKQYGSNDFDQPPETAGGERRLRRKRCVMICVRISPHLLHCHRRC
ncbi:unnamed protein product [Cylicocyclus nassatus]|uniref:Uncharacterized protein n=1 Tax=Cylicocyclus nassatus TaxID=53992 RepID=A0AA36M1K3_CYLNA|nr:unnamed protein product [Cylicocyclus nassatus]